MRITGPLFSIEAHGSLAGLLTAATSRGRQYMKKRKSPRVTYTYEQRSARARLAFLKTLWSHINAIMGLDAQALWLAASDQATETAYSYFLKYNMRRWQDEQGPVAYPGCTDFSTQDPSWGNARYTATTASFTTNFTGATFYWGSAVYMDPDFLFPEPRSRIAYCQAEWPGIGATTTITITHIPPGTYGFFARALRTDGVLQDQSAFASHTFP